MDRSRPKKEEIRSMGGTNKLVHYDMDHKANTYIPEHVKKDGFNYRWERYLLKGAADSAFANAMRNGWKPVPLSRYPEFGANDITREFSKGDRIQDKYICTGDVIYMERETELCKQEQRYHAKLAEKRLEDNAAYNFRS
jgi:hypothetical protein